MHAWAQLDTWRRLTLAAALGFASALQSMLVRIAAWFGYDGARTAGP